MVTLLEKELTKEQVEWLLNNPDHIETKKVIIGARVADWALAESSEKKEEIFKKVCLIFRKWWTNKN